MGNLLNKNFSSSLTYGQKSDLCFWRVVRRFRAHFGVKKADGRTSIPSPFVSLTEIFGKDRDGFTVAIQKSPGLTENPLFTGRWGIKQSALHNRTIQFFDDQNKRQVIFVSHRINELFNIDEFFLEFDICIILGAENKQVCLLLFVRYFSSSELKQVVNWSPNNWISIHNKPKLYFSH